MTAPYLITLNKLDGYRADIKNDPRLVHISGMKIPLNSAPRIPDIDKTLKIGYYKSYNDITGGDVVYYLDPVVNKYFPEQIYGSSIRPVFIRSPFTPLANRSLVGAVTQQDMNIPIKSIRDGNQFRADLISRQQLLANTYDPTIFE